MNNRSGSSGVRPSPGAATLANQVRWEHASAPPRTKLAAPGDGRTPLIRPRGALAAFTLIELLVVIALIAILAGLLLPAPAG